MSVAVTYNQMFLKQPIFLAQNLDKVCSWERPYKKTHVLKSIDVLPSKN